MIKLNELLNSIYPESYAIVYAYQGVNRAQDIIIGKVGDIGFRQRAKAYEDCWIGRIEPKILESGYPELNGQPHLEIVVM